MNSIINVVNVFANRVISCGIQAEAMEESFDFTVYPDRNEDIIAKIEDLLTVDNKNCNDLQKVLDLAKIVVPNEMGNLTMKELTIVKEEIKNILAHRYHVREWLKKSVELFQGHSAFQKMEKLKLLPKLKDITKAGQKAISNEVSVGSSIEGEGSAPREEDKKETVETDKTWITLEGNLQVRNDGSAGVLVKLPYQDGIQLYAALTCDEKIILSIRLLRQLLTLIANLQCSSKVAYFRISETKSLVKRLKMRERLDGGLQTAILEQHKYLERTLTLTKGMRFLKDY